MLLLATHLSRSKSVKLVGPQGSCRAWSASTSAVGLPRSVGRSVGTEDDTALGLFWTKKQRSSRYQMFFFMDDFFGRYVHAHNIYIYKIIYITYHITNCRDVEIPVWCSFVIFFYLLSLGTFWCRLGASTSSACCGTTIGCRRALNGASVVRPEDLPKDLKVSIWLRCFRWKMMEKWPWTTFVDIFQVNTWWTTGFRVS